MKSVIGSPETHQFFDKMVFCHQKINMRWVRHYNNQLTNNCSLIGRVDFRKSSFVVLVVCEALFIEVQATIEANLLRVGTRAGSKRILHTKKKK